MRGKTRMHKECGSAGAHANGLLEQCLMGTHQNHPLAAYLALVFGILCIGFGGIFVKLAGVPGPASAFYRVLIAGIVIVPWWLARVNQRPTAQDIRLIIAGGIFYALDNALWNTSLLLTSAATATLLANNAPLWVGLASFILLHERLSKRFWLGLAVALVGMGWLLGSDAYLQLRLNSGNLLAVGASVFYAVYLLTTQRARSRVDLLTFMAISMLSSIAVLLLINLALGTALTGYSSRSWLALTGLGLVSQLGGWLGINFALGHLRAAPVSVWLLGQVVVTALVAMPLLGEYVQLSQLVGGAMVLTGILFVTPGNDEKRIQVPE
jgi:drug/metabolite transporter (DMT)-like permease